MNIDLNEVAREAQSVAALAEATAHETKQEIERFKARYEAELRPEVLAEKVKALRAVAVDAHRSPIADALAQVKAVTYNAAQWSREAALRRAPLVTPTQLPIEATNESRAVVQELSLLRESNARLHLDAVLSRATDEQLVERYAASAIRDGNAGVMGMVLDEAERRGGLVGQRVRMAAEQISLPDVDAAEKLIERIERQGRDLESARHLLQTGEEDLHAKVRKYSDMREAG